MDRERWRADVRLGPRDQETGWPAAVANIWDIDKRKCTWEWPCWPSQDGGCASRAGLRGLGGRPVEDSSDTCRAAGDAYGVCYSWAGLVVWTSKPSVAGLRVWTSKPGRRFRGGTDDTWRHRGVRVEAKLLMRRRGGRRMKDDTGLDHNTLRLSGLTQLYLGAKLELCNSPVK
jgi:hypothetical protein